MYDVNGGGLHLHGGVNLTARNNLLYGVQCASAGGCDLPFAHSAVGFIEGATKWPQTLPNGSVIYIDQPFSVNASLNVVVTTASTLFASDGVWPNAGDFYPASAVNASFDENIYYSTNATGNAPLRFPLGLNLTTWRAASGCDLSSVIADPLIADADGSNFTLLAGSPALALGFRQIDQSNVGPRWRLPGK